MRREQSSASSKKRSAPPAAQAFYEAQAAAIEAEPLPDLAAQVDYAWDEVQAPPAEPAREEIAQAPPDWERSKAFDSHHPAPPVMAPPPSGPPGMPMPTGAPTSEVFSRVRPFIGLEDNNVYTIEDPEPIPTRKARSAPAPRKPAMSMPSFEKTSEELQMEATGAQVVETGFWIWRNVIVPPNVYVVHTRRGKLDPVTEGLGKSFRYNPLTDSYLVVPAAMQTIGIFARCISAEKQGINVLAYVQWLISDFSLAYKRLDFSNIADPMGIVNTQLKEQAEAAIKDTVSTMTVEQVLKDKAPIIQELTERMKSVAEGRDGDGLGLKIVTVQIKEAMIASTSLWDNLQAPFRHEKSRVARLSEIETEAEIHRRSREAALDREAADAKAASEIAKLRAQVELDNRQASLASQVKQQELAQKAEQDEQRYRQETALQRIAIEQRLEADRHQSELIRLSAEADTTIQQVTAEAALGIQRMTIEAEADLARMRAQLARDSEAELSRLRADQQREAEAARIAAESRAAALDVEQRLTLARIAAEQAELAAAEVLAVARREAEAVDLRARMALDRDRLRAKLDAERQLELQRLEFKVQTDAQLAAHLRAEAEVERLRQETINGKSPAALQGELVAVLPAIASQMPAIAEYRYVGVGGDSSGAFDALPTFMAKALGVAQGFGIKLPGQDKDEA